MEQTAQCAHGIVAEEMGGGGERDDYTGAEREEGFSCEHIRTVDGFG
jgi:hypothetical protein